MEMIWERPGQLGCALSSQLVRQGWGGPPAEKGLLIHGLGLFCVLAPFP